MKKSEVTATGRRKRSVAQVKLVTGKGKITVNGRDVNEYMPFPTLVMDLKWRRRSRTGAWTTWC